MVDDFSVMCTSCKEKGETERVCSKYVLYESIV